MLPCWGLPAGAHCCRPLDLSARRTNWSYFEQKRGTAVALQQGATLREPRRAVPVLDVLVELIDVLAHSNDRVCHGGELLLRALRGQVLDSARFA